MAGTGDEALIAPDGSRGEPVREGFSPIACSFI
jgi:hypothetical protein